MNEESIEKNKTNDNERITTVIGYIKELEGSVDTDENNPQDLSSLQETIADLIENSDNKELLTRISVDDGLMKVIQASAKMRLMTLEQ